MKTSYSAKLYLAIVIGLDDDVSKEKIYLQVVGPVEGTYRWKYAASPNLKALTKPLLVIQT